jgi:hypothetical protein
MRMNDQHCRNRRWGLNTAGTKPPHWTQRRGSHPQNLLQQQFSEGFGALTAAVVNTYIYWSVTPCSPVKVNRRFEWICRFHLQGTIISHARKQCDSWWQAEQLYDVSCLLYSSALKMEAKSSSERFYVQRTTRLTSKITELFYATRIS